MTILETKERVLNREYPILIIQASLKVIFILSPFLILPSQVTVDVPPTASTLRWKKNWIRGKNDSNFEPSQDFKT